MKTRSSIKNGKYVFHTGKKKATESEVKQYLKINHELKFSKAELDTQYSRYLGAVRGGHKRADNSLRDAEGSFIPKDLQEQLVKQLGIDIEKVREGKGFESYDKMFANHPAIKKQFDRIQQTGIERTHNKSTAAKKIQEFKGKIFINGKEVSNETAARRVNSTMNKLKRAFGSIDSSVKFRYKGVKELRINLPTQSVIDESDGIQEFLENYEYGDDWEIYGS